MSDDLNEFIEPDMVSVTVSDYVTFTTTEFVNQSLSAHNISDIAHQDIRDLLSGDNNVLSAYAMLSGANFFGNISALNLSGINTGDQDLSPYANLSGAVFTENIYSPNISSINIVNTNSIITSSLSSIDINFTGALSISGISGYTHSKKIILMDEDGNSLEVYLRGGILTND